MDQQLDVLFAKRFEYQKAYAETNMRQIVALAQQYDIPLTSHDDTTDENVTDAVRDRVSVAEFPTTLEAARGLHAARIGILMGARMSCAAARIPAISRRRSTCWRLIWLPPCAWSARRRPKRSA
jgi:imidazolonepropionase-like amidohydrolase